MQGRGRWGGRQAGAGAGALGVHGMQAEVRGRAGRAGVAAGARTVGAHSAGARRQGAGAWSVLTLACWLGCGLCTWCP